MKLREAVEKAKEAREMEIQRLVCTPEGALPVAAPEAPTIAPRPGTGSTSKSYAYNPKIAAKNRCVCLTVDCPEAEAYKFLRTQIHQRTEENGWNTFMITSIRAGEGKTTTAINLALAFAREYSQTVLLVDCDLRAQKIHDYLGVESDGGLGDYLMSDRPLNDLMIRPGIDKFSLISGGKTIPDSTELLGSPKMKALVAEMKERYPERYVFLDVPALLERADALTFAPQVDGIIVVVEAGRTASQDIKKAMGMLPPEKFLGFVLNRQGQS